MNALKIKSSMKSLGQKRALSTIFVATVMLFSWVAPTHVNAQTVEVPQNDASEMISVLSETLIQTLNDQREELENNPTKVKEFADTYVLPYVDAPRMARYIMGRYWRTTTEQQQVAFQEEFTTMLLRSYSQSLLKLQITSVVVRPQVEEKPGRVTVASVVTQADGNKTEVIYRAYWNEKMEAWMVYDVAVEGISMLLNYRSTYASEFGKRSVDEVLQSMREQNKEFNGQE